MTKNLTPTVGDGVVVGLSTKQQRVGRVIKVLAPNPPSPGGYVVENEFSKFYVAPWENIVVAIRLFKEGN